MLHAAGQRACSLKNPAAGSGSLLVQRRWECLPHRVRTPSFARQRAQAAGAPLLALSCNPYPQLAVLPAQGAGVAGELVHVIPQRDAQVNALRGAPSQVGGSSVAALQRRENQLCRSVAKRFGHPSWVLQSRASYPEAWLEPQCWMGCVHAIN